MLVPVSVLVLVPALVLALALTPHTVATPY
jgi:hypothetical protein